MAFIDILLIIIIGVGAVAAVMACIFEVLSIIMRVRSLWADEDHCTSIVINSLFVLLVCVCLFMVVLLGM